MDNPFETINNRLTNIEVLLLDLKQRQETVSVVDDDLPLDVKQAADILKISIPTIYSKVSRKEVPGVSKVGRRLFFDRQALLEYIKAGSRKTSKQIQDEVLDKMSNLKRRRNKR